MGPGGCPVWAIGLVRMIHFERGSQVDTVGAVATGVVFKDLISHGGRRALGSKAQMDGQPDVEVATNDGWTDSFDGRCSGRYRTVVSKGPVSFGGCQTEGSEPRTNVVLRTYRAQVGAGFWGLKCTRTDG